MSNLTDDQTYALHELLAFLNDSGSKAANIALLQGGPGTGKTYLLKKLLDEYKFRAIVTAPTNKATKVLKEMLTTPDYIPQAMTTFSLLGLSMSANGEVKEIVAPEESVDLSRFHLVVVDEASMVSSVLLNHLLEAVDSVNLKLLFIGDNLQLPPVGEAQSPAWKLMRQLEEDKIPHLNLQLTQVMRHDGNILEVVRQVRVAANSPYAFKLPFLNDFKPGSVLDVKVVPQVTFAAMITEDALIPDYFTDKSKVKVIAWRNLKVAAFNEIVKGGQLDWAIGDRVIATAPAKNADGKTIATTDEEGIIISVDSDCWLADSSIKVDIIKVVTDYNETIVFTVVNQNSLGMYERIKAELLAEAKATPRKWKAFWSFIDTFHYIKHAYAITAHRSQGSTYDKVYVDMGDILKNQTKKEALQCLHVAVSRASKQLIIGR